MAYLKQFSTQRPVADIIFNKQIVEFLQERLVGRSETTAISISELIAHFKCHLRQITPMVRQMAKNKLLTYTLTPGGGRVSTIILHSSLMITQKELNQRNAEKKMLSAVWIDLEPQKIEL